MPIDIQARLSAIQSRIGEIQTRFAAPAPQAPAGATAFGALMDRLGASPETAAPAGAAPVAAASSLAGMIAGAARRQGLDPALVDAVVRVESGYDPKAVSPVGARGLMQLMPGTAAGLGVDPDDPAQNLEGGTRYLAEQIHRFGLESGVAAYNAGPGAVEKHGGVPPYAETQAYVQKVLSLYREASPTVSGGNRP